MYSTCMSCCYFISHPQDRWCLPHGELPLCLAWPCFDGFIYLWSLAKDGVLGLCLTNFLFMSLHAGTQAEEVIP